MKKYSKLIVLLVIVVAMFSFYYMQAGTLSDTFEQFNIRTVEGDEALLDDVSIIGDHYGEYQINESFKIGRSGINYLRDGSFIERLEDYYISDKVQQLRKENRQFMRMKNSEERAYLEYDDTIIYVSVPYSRWGVFKGYLQVETYNRKTKEKSISKIDTPDLLDYSMVEKMYLREDELYIIVLNMEYDLTTDTEKTVLNLYAYNLTDETVTNTYEVTMGDTNYYSDFTHIFVDNEENPTELIVTGTAIDYEEIERMAEDATKIEDFLEEGEDYREITELNAVKKINLQTGDVTELNIKNLVENGMPVAFNGSEIIFVAPKDDKLVYYAYDIVAESMVEKLTVDIDTNFISMWDFEMSIVKDNKVYSLINHNAGNTATLIVLDISTVQLLYKGLIESDSDDPVIQNHTDVYFHTLELLEK